MSTNKTARERISEELSPGPQTVKHLMGKLPDIKEATLRMTLYRMQIRGEVVQTPRLQRDGGMLFGLVEE